MIAAVARFPAAIDGGNVVLVHGLSKSAAASWRWTTNKIARADVWSYNTVRRYGSMSASGGGGSCGGGGSTRIRLPMQEQQKQQLQFQARRLLSSPGRPEFQEDIAIIDQRVHLKNAALGLALTAFVFGVANYSMNAVGQASRADDPLAALQQEAAAARAAQSKELQETEQAAAMLQKFEKGEYDPDAAEQQALMEEEEAEAKKLKSWWKIW